MTKKQDFASTDRHLGYLDALRGIAILGVIFVHAGFVTDQRGRMAILVFTGQRGVQLFYMLSAFTLYLSLDSGREETHRVSNFFLRRFFRIAPLYYLAIALTFALCHLAPVLSSREHMGALDLLMGFTFLTGIRPGAINNVVSGGWSVAVETTFYLMLPFLFRSINSLRRALLLFLVSAPILFKLSEHLAHDSSDVVHEQFFALFWFPVEFPVFVLGILCYWIWKDYVKSWISDGANLNKRRNLSLLLIFSSFVLYYASLPFIDERLYPSSFLFIPLILALAIYPWRFLVNGVTRFIGKISFSIYLVHTFVLDLLVATMRLLDRQPAHLVTRYIYTHPIAFPIFFLLLLGLSIPPCMLTWRYVEQPGIRLGRRWIARREGGGERRGNTSLLPSEHELESAGNTRDAQF